MATREEFLVGSWLVQPSLDRVSRSGAVVHLRPRAMDVLVCLARRPGQVVVRETIIDEVWSKEYVSDAALKTAVYELREAFGDSCRSPQVIETIPKRGYRLIAPVETVATVAAAAVDEAGAPYRLAYGQRQIPIGEGETVIGRDAEAAIRIDSCDVSRRHARIVVASGRAVVEDLGSKNGTFVRGRRIVEPVELASGDKIVVGHTALIFKVVGVPGTTVTAEAPEDDRYREESEQRELVRP